MSSTINTNQSIGDIVTKLPKASSVFKKYKIDFCCGGNRPLIEAIREQEINEDVLLQELETAYEDSKSLSSIKDFTIMSKNQLIDYIVDTHHVFVRQILPELSEFTTKIMQVHGMNHRELFTVHKLFHNLKTELEQHLIKEEDLLFPLIKKYEQESSEDLLGQIQEVMQETEDEHDAAGDIIKELRTITNDYTLPEDACTTYFLSYEKLKALESDLFEHIHLENNILFKEFE
ncbi:iron-sulfur cluster repair di-iron protein [Haloplasma contractile]|uniref:Iron-sulfur cluster repair di-iron protein n=1 Tax=Haloplasma contractile SSD-17B TaxID=1033810 RepID=U2FLQ6_9MOLU|nr:iron-sulfur cluster repair di-iron protein [Haloplasma contractile]ERJ12124.1 Iron-sulfur cluster repair di-iron protein [Haloplasma contractile SSD-17B]